LQEALRLPAGQTVNGLYGHHGLNRQVGICWRGARLSGQFIGRPILDGFRTDTDGEASSLFERGLILAPVAGAVSGVLFHGKKAYHITASAMTYFDSCNKAQFGATCGSISEILRAEGFDEQLESLE
jgi:hypothetical protein